MNLFGQPSVEPLLSAFIPRGQVSWRERVDRERPTASQQHGPCLGWGVPGLTGLPGLLALAPTNFACRS